MLHAFPAFQTLSVRVAFTLSAGEWCIVGVGAAVIVGAIVAAVVISKKKKKK